MPDKILMLVGLRMLFCVSVLISLQLLKRRFFRKYHSATLLSFNLILACNIINYMIFKSGDHKSFYILGTILTSLIGINIFRLPRAYIITSLVICYLPCWSISAILGGYSAWRDTLILGAFQLSLIVIHFFFTKDEESMHKKITQKEIYTDEQLKKFQKTEILKSQFPASLKKQIEDGKIEVPESKIIPNAVVGFVDISNSTKIGNKISLQQDWYLKERFLEIATKLATQHELVVLTNLGDGFLFIANYDGTSEWPINTISFFESLSGEYTNLKNEMLPHDLDIETGIKCGISMGPTYVGFMGKTQSYFTATGPDVNLAARLCSESKPNELVVTTRTWDAFKNVMIGWETKSELFKDLKGFNYNIGAVRITARIVAKESNEMRCASCKEVLRVVKQIDGIFALSCPNGHDQNGTEIEIKRKIS